MFKREKPPELTPRAKAWEEQMNKQNKYVKAVFESIMVNDEWFKNNIFRYFYISHADSLDILLFFKTDREIIVNYENGKIEEMKKNLLSHFDTNEYRDQFGSEIRIEIDSHQNVKRKYKGNYFFRLRG